MNNFDKSIINVHCYNILLRGIPIGCCSPCVHAVRASNSRRNKRFGCDTCI